MPFCPPLNPNATLGLLQCAPSEALSLDINQSQDLLCTLLPPCSPKEKAKVLFGWSSIPFRQESGQARETAEDSRSRIYTSEESEYEQVVAKEGNGTIACINFVIQAKAQRVNC